MNKKKSLLIILLVMFVVGFIWGAFVAPKQMYPIKYPHIISENAQKYDIDPFLILSLIKVESKFREQARSNKGACGLMQIMPETGEWIAERLDMQNYSQEDLFDPETNIRMGVWYIAELMNYYDQNLYLAVAAYNGGMGNVSEWIEDGTWSGKIEDYKDIPFRETSKYVRSIDMTYRMYESIYRSKWPAN